MTAAAQDLKAERLNRRFFASSFFLGLLAFAFVLLVAGGGGFAYLTANSPLALLSGGDRPIAAATAFVPADSPATFSLLTKPEKLLTLQQAIAAPEQRQQAQREADQLKQSLLKNTGLDYDQDIQPWVGNELTFAVADTDLDVDSSNGQQLGYLLAIEIAADKQQQAREFLQLFWQRQTLKGRLPKSEQMSGVRVLYRTAENAESLTAATALVGDSFILFANDLRVLHRSIQVAQTAANLAQNRAYRQAVAQLPASRLGLAYLDLAALRGNASAHSLIAVGLGANRAGITADVQFIGMSEPERSPAASNQDTTKTLNFLPADSAMAITGQDLSQLATSLAEANLSGDALPDFLRMGEPALWDWASEAYALGQLKADGDWILVALRDAEGVARLDDAASAQGYSAVPVAMGEDEAIAWTRFKASAKSNSQRRTFSSLETEVLGLHLQQNTAQGEYEIFASSLSAMESALLAPQNSLLASARFTQAIASLPQPNSGYFYADWQAIAPTLSRNFPLFSRLESAARPLLSHIDTLAATRDGNAAEAFAPLSQRS